MIERQSTRTRVLQVNTDRNLLQKDGLRSNLSTGSERSRTECLVPRVGTRSKICGTRKVLVAHVKDPEGQTEEEKGIFLHVALQH